MSTHRNHPAVFFIAPIGQGETATRRRSDVIFANICEPIALLTSSPCIRADHILEVGLVIEQILYHLLHSEFVIADLAGGNPNVMYELAIRHATGKPCFCLGRPEEKVPYDIAPLRVFNVNESDKVSLQQTSDALVDTVKQIRTSGAGPQSPLSEPLGTWRLRADQSAFDLTELDTAFKQYGALRVLAGRNIEALRGGSAPHGFAGDLVREIDSIEIALETLQRKSGLPSLDSYVQLARATNW